MHSDNHHSPTSITATIRRYFFQKADLLHNIYGPKFERFLVTVHKKNLPGDIPGKCSNINYAARTTMKYLRADPTYGLDRDDTEVFVTTGDCDTIFGERYFEALEEDYWKIEEKVVMRK
ncbi:unnamed protein product [Gongylonema pulchrum]|uniref:Uncharacterized protein n=2 Tax=Gongylonema pulchrum TaxID=637853 RepID=A0A3P7PL51_9BILA|nr:unnamed protein product [Gongylonema pulchrum]